MKQIVIDYLCRFPEFLGLRPRWFPDVGSVTAFLSAA